MSAIETVAETEKKLKKERKEKKGKKEKKEKKEKKSKSKSSKTEDEPNPVADGAADVPMKETSPPPSAKKRKREVLPEGELEIDINAPEPPSKRAMRRLKKGKPLLPSATAKDEDSEDEEDEDDATGEAAAEKPAKRSEYGIWIGNLPWSATKAGLRQFLEKGGIKPTQITRVHMPAPKDAPNAVAKVKPMNKGFAYVDFSTPEALEAAMALSETLFDTRRVLIKNAKSFEGRPEKPKSAEAEQAVEVAKSGKPPSKRVFVGNLGFDVTKDDLELHFAQCGDVEDIHVATFEDTGKCKGYAWITFADLEAAKSAVAGFIQKPIEDSDDESEDEKEGDEEKSAEASKKKKKGKKTRKWFVNRLHARPLRCEFAEDAASRYKKRFGKEASSQKRDADAEPIQEVSAEEPRQKSKFNKARPAPRKFDARTVKPGAALANAQRSTGAIVESKGTKITFD